MINKNWIFTYIFLLLIVEAASMAMVASAQEQQTSGPYKQFKCATLTQICANCTYVNITSILMPTNGTNAIRNIIGMTRNDTNYNATLCNTGTLGNYIVNYKHNSAGINDIGNWDFNITTTGLDIPISLLFFMTAFVYVIVFLGVFKRDITTTLLGTILLYFLGLFILLFGFNIYRSGLTEAFAFVTLGLAGYLSILMASEYIT